MVTVSLHFATHCLAKVNLHYLSTSKAASANFDEREVEQFRKDFLNFDIISFGPDLADKG